MPACARISLAHLADATGIVPEALAAERMTLQRASGLILPDRAAERRGRRGPPQPSAEELTSRAPVGANETAPRQAAA